MYNEPAIASYPAIPRAVLFFQTNKPYTHVAGALYVGSADDAITFLSMLLQSVTTLNVVIWTKTKGVLVVTLPSKHNYYTPPLT